MASPTITFAGIGSGIDTNSIVTGLVQANSGTLTSIQNEASTKQAAVTELSSLSTLLSTLKTAADAVGTTQAASSYTASVSGTGATATADGTAVAGNFSVDVLALAQEQRTYSNTFSSSSDALGQSGTLQIGVGTATPASISVSSTDSLQNIADKINASGIRASASVFYDGSAYRLQVRGLDTGAANAINFSETGTSLGLGTAANTVQQAQDSKVKIDGFTVTRPTNQVTGVIQGVTLQLTQPTTTPLTVSVAADSSSLGAKLQTVVSAYNAVVAQVHTSAGYGTTAGDNSVLQGDSTLRQLSSNMSDSLLTVVSGGGKFSSLADIGLSLNEDGTMALDQTKLATAMAADPASVANVLAGSPGTKGVMDVVSDLVSNFTDFGSGLLTMETQSLTDQVSTLNDDATTEQNRLNAYSDQLKAQFTAMDTVVSGYKADANYLSRLYGGDTSSS
jgi:flagellar hook-associated protein 2